MLGSIHTRPSVTGQWILIRDLIKLIGDDPDRPGLRDTPQRVIESYHEMFGGYGVDVSKLFTIFDEPCDEMVILKDIEFTSFCEHHLLPFMGVAHIGYIPKANKVIGASKLARVLECFARRLQIQERICQQVVNALMEHLQPHGAACVIEASHLCMQCRGVRKHHCKFITSCMRGVFRDNDSLARSEFMQFIKG